MTSNLLQIYRIIPEKKHLCDDMPVDLRLSDHYHFLRLMDNSIIVSKMPQRNIQHYSTYKCYKLLLNQHIYLQHAHLLDKLREEMIMLAAGSYSKTRELTLSRVQHYILLAGGQWNPFGYETTENHYKIRYLNPVKGDLLHQFFSFYKTEKIVRSLLYPMDYNIRPLSDQLIRTSHNFLTYERFASIYSEIQSSFFVCIREAAQFYELTPHEADEKICKGISLCDNNNSLDLSGIENELQNGHIFVFFQGRDAITISQVNFQHLYLFAPHICTLTGNGCGFDTVELRNCQNLRKLNISENHIISLRLCGYLELLEVELQKNCLVNLEIDSCPVLSSIDCSKNKLQSLQITQCAGLRFLDVSCNEIVDIDLSAFPLLETLYAQRNGLKRFSCSRNEEVVEVNVSSNALISLDVEGCARLEELFVEENLICTINLQGCAELRVLWAFNNRLTQVNVQECSKLAILWLEDNSGLSEVIVMNCIALVEVLVDDSNILVE